MHQLPDQGWWATPQALPFIMFWNEELVFQRKEAFRLSKAHAFLFLLLSHNKKNKQNKTKQKKVSNHSGVKCHREHSDYAVTRSSHPVQLCLEA